MDGRLDVTQGDLYDLLAVGSANLWKSDGLAWIKALEKLRARLMSLDGRNDRGRARKNVELALRSRPSALRPVPRRRPAIFLRLFRASRPDAGGGAARQEAAYRRQAAGRRAPSRARHRLRLGRHGPLSRAADRRPRRRRDAEPGAARHRAAARAARGRHGDRARISGCTDYRDVEGPFERIVSVGMFEHVGRAHFDEYFSQRQPPADRRRRDAAARHRPQLRARLHQPLGRKSTSSPAATSPPCRRCWRRSRGRACSSPTSRSCACTTPTR